MNLLYSIENGLCFRESVAYPPLIMDVSVALWPDKRKGKRHIKKCLRHFMKNLRFLLCGIQGAQRVGEDESSLLD